MLSMRPNRTETPKSFTASLLSWRKHRTRVPAAALRYLPRSCESRFASESRSRLKRLQITLAQKENRMHRSMHFAIAIAGFGILAIEPAAAQPSANPGLTLSVAGIRAKDYAES